MSLIEAMMDECTIIDKVTEQDGEGGHISVWRDGARIQAAIVHNSSMEAQIAEKQGVTSVYTITTMRSVVLDYHTVLRREKDGLIFRVTSEPQDIVSPSVSTLDIRNVTAEKWSLPS